MKRFDIEPRLSGKVHLGSDKRESLILAGRLAERGNVEDLYFDASDNFVVLEVGKRGSGKSYGMGSLLECFATQPGSKIGVHADPRAVVLLDPLDIHWTAIYPLTPDGPEAMRKQHAVFQKWGNGLELEPIDARVFMPAGHGWETDPSEFLDFQLPVSSLDAGDWSLLLRTDLMTETRGRLIDEAYRKVTELGWTDDGGTERDPIDGYGIEDLIECIDRDPDIVAFYASETRRSVVQPLRSFARMPLFSSPSGTPLTEFARVGTLSILCLARLDDLQARRKWRWHPTPIALRWTSARKRLSDRPMPFLWNGFAEVSCHAYRDVEVPERRTDTRTIANYLARGYRTVKRSVGHTPFDSVALMAMAFGVEDGLAIEMVDFHRMMLIIKTQGLLQGEVFFASGNTLDKMFVSLREDFVERVVAALPERLEWEAADDSARDGAV